MSITQDVVILNDIAQERIRTTSKGTSTRYTLSVDAEKIVADFSEENLGAGPAAAIAQAIKTQIGNITAIAKPSTIMRRRSAKRQLEGGVAEDTKSMRRTAFAKKEIAAGRGHLLGNDGMATMQRYSGGRLGFMPPSGSVRLFNDSGRLKEGIFVRQNPQEKNWTINVAANRLDPSTFGSRAAFMGMIERLASFVPALRNPLADKDVQKAILQGVNDMLTMKIEKGLATRAQIEARIRGAKLQLLQSFRSLLG